MKKALFLLLIVGLILSVTSCKRSTIDDPEWDSPVGFYVLLEGSANPAVFFIDGVMRPSTIYARVTDGKGNPLAGETIFFEQLRDSTSHSQVEWGYFEGNAATIKKVTNANGEVRVTFYSPVKFYSAGMIIHALMQVDDRAYRGSTSHVSNIPQDFIAITMINSGGAAAGTTK
ncbi:MAG: Ig-like domain-containing protein [Chrysiogenia bacterium]